MSTPPLVEDVGVPTGVWYESILISTFGSQFAMIKLSLRQIEQEQEQIPFPTNTLNKNTWSRYKDIKKLIKCHYYRPRLAN